MAKSQMEQAAGLYANLMSEVKVRIAFIGTVANGHLEMPASIAREVCYLQLRFVCELIALGCLLLHGDIKAAQAKDITKSYKADDLMRRLEGLHPDFYPKPSIPERTKYGVHFAAKPDGYLTKEDLVALVRKAGAIVHRGSLRKLLKDGGSAPRELPDVHAWASKIIGLLEQHVMLSKDHDRSVVCVMNDPSAGGQVRVVAAVAATPSPPPA